jgi:hypothetical protein
VSEILPDCMIGPNDPCKGFQQLQSKIDQLTKAYEELYSRHTNLINDGQRLYVEKLEKQLEDLNQNCISLSLHESRLAAREMELEKVQKERDSWKASAEHHILCCDGYSERQLYLVELMDKEKNESKALLTEALAGRDQWRKTHLDLTDAVKERDEILKCAELNEENCKLHRFKLTDAVKALEKLETEEFYWVYESHRDENNKEHPGLMKKIHEIRQFARETLQRIKGK